MAVSKSPFSKGNKGGSDGGNRFNPKYDTSGLENIDKLIAAGKIKQQSSNTSDFADIGTKTTLGEEKRKLDSAYDTALSRIATSSMSDKDKDRYRKKFEQLYKTGKSDVDVSGFNPFNPVDYGRAALKGVKEVATSILDGAEFVSRAGQVGLKYTPSFGPVAGLKAVGIIQSAPITEDPRKTLSNIKKDVTNKDFRLVKQTGNKYIDAIVDFGVDVVHVVNFPLVFNSLLKRDKIIDSRFSNLFIDLDNSFNSFFFVISLFTELCRFFCRLERMFFKFLNFCKKFSNFIRIFLLLFNPEVCFSSC